MSVFPTSARFFYVQIEFLFARKEHVFFGRERLMTLKWFGTSWKGEQYAKNSRPKSKWVSKECYEFQDVVANSSFSSLFFTSFWTFKSSQIKMQMSWTIKKMQWMYFWYKFHKSGEKYTKSKCRKIELKAKKDIINATLGKKTCKWIHVKTFHNEKNNHLRNDWEKLKTSCNSISFVRTMQNHFYR